MRAFSDYETTREYTDFRRLPAGAYEVRIIRAEEQNGALCILFDIASGEFTDYFRKRLADDRKSFGEGSAKFKGVYRLWYPNGGQFDDSSKRRMKTVLKLIKEDNNLAVDFTKEWDGEALKGARVGMIFRDKEWEWQGKKGISAQPYGVISLADLREGNFTIPEPKYLSGTAPTASAGYDEASPLSDEDLPF